jgi:DHA1 family tetracycline resistance protein-like MFS transporter
MAIVSPLVASTVFSHFTGPSALILLPGAPFVVSAVAYCLALWAVAGVRPPAALARAEADATLLGNPKPAGGN